MNVESVVADARLAALTLHALAPDDRRWVLERMAAPEQARLQPLLDELLSLGIPSDPELVRSAIAAAPRATPAPMLRADPAALERLLAGEPERLVARCLNLLDADTRSALLDRLEGAPRAALEAAARGAMPAPALDAALHRHLAERLAAGRPPEARR